MSKQQNTPLKFNPVNGNPLTYSVDASQWREACGSTPWRVNPWTGDVRNVQDCTSDPTGLLIVPPGESLFAWVPTVEELDALRERAEAAEKARDEAQAEVVALTKSVARLERELKEAQVSVDPRQVRAILAAAILARIGEWSTTWTEVRSSTAVRLADANVEALIAALNKE